MDEADALVAFGYDLLMAVVLTSSGFRKVLFMYTYIHTYDYVIGKSV